METKNKTKPVFARPLNFRVNPELYREFALVAQANDRSVAGELRRIMREHIEAQRRDGETERAA